jgi:phosphoethanolamine N-methyltransferase
MSGTAHQDEYHDAMVALLELVWSEGFMAPGGAELVRETLAGLDLRDKLVVDIGCGIGGGSLVLAGEKGARVIGLDLEAPLLERARRYAEAAGLASRIEFILTTPGPLPLDDASVDVVYSSGVFTQIAEKLGMFREIFRVLRPGGLFVSYDWMRGPEPYSADMRYWFELEGLTYAMETLEAHGPILTEAGFEAVELADDGGWYRRKAHEEYALMKGPLAAKMLELLGPEEQAHFLEDWRMLTVVLDKGELRPGRFRGRKPR